MKGLIVSSLMLLMCLNGLLIGAFGLEVTDWWWFVGTEIGLLLMIVFVKFVFLGDPDDE